MKQFLCLISFFMYMLPGNIAAKDSKKSRSPLHSSRPSKSTSYDTNGGAPGRMGVGFILGSPTGFTFKSHHQRSNFYDITLAYSLRSGETFHIHGDYLWQFPDQFRVDNVPMFTYFGLGARLKHFDKHKKNDDFALGARVPAGFGYFVPQTQLELFAELALIMDVFESTDVDFNGGVGGRFWF